MTIASIPAAFARSINAVARTVTRRIVVANDVEPSQRVGEQDGGEMGCRERRQHRHVGQELSERQHRLDAFAGRHDFATDAEADRIAEKIAHRAPPSRRRVSGALSRRRIEPGAMRAGDPTAEIGDGAIIAGQVSVGECSSGR